MTIAIDCRMSGKSGIGTFLDGILPFFVQSQHHLLLLGFDNARPTEAVHRSIVTAQNVTCIPCDIEPFSPAEMFHFPKQIAKQINSADCFFSPYCNIPSGIHIPKYTTIHDIVFLDIKGIASPLGTLVRGICYRYAIWKSRAIFTVSQFSKERIQKRLGCKKPIHVVYNGIPSYIEQEPSRSIPKTNTIIFIGNVKKHKGLLTLLDAFAKLRIICGKKSLVPPELVVVGSGERLRTAETIPDHAREGVTFTGHVSDEQLLELLAAARFLVQPSLYEGFGIPPLQALCLGTKALISDIPVFREIYSGFPVVFFEAGNPEDLCTKMEALYTDKSPLPAIPARYSYRRTAALIQQALERS